MMTATAGLLVSGGDPTLVNVAATMGANAAQYNALAHGQAVALANKLKVACAGDPQCMNNAVYNAQVGVVGAQGGAGGGGNQLHFLVNPADRSKVFELVSGSEKMLR